MSAVTSWVYVVDYDIPAGKQRSKTESNRVMFYQAVHRMLRKKLGEDVKFSTYSCYFTPDEQLAKDFLGLVHQHNGKGNLYKAVKMQ
jgi:hypothetical protein